jgi:hypothetical protein
MMNRSMFPFRRGGGKKRGKGGPGQRHPHLHPRDGRRVPGSAGDLLPMLQPTTKALAQMLAGNTKSSGQLVHARNILAQAQRLVDERQVDRLPPMQREEFLEQLARLKLTLADADEAGLQEAAPAAEQRPAASIAPDTLRDVARRLALASETAAAPPDPAPPVAADQDEQPSEEQPVASDEPAGAAKGDRLRLRLSSDPDAPAPVRARDRLRLRPLKPAAGSSGD